MCGGGVNTSPAKVIYDFMIQEVIVRNGSLIPSRSEKRSVNVMMSNDIYLKQEGGTAWGFFPRGTVVSAANMPEGHSALPSPHLYFIHMIILAGSDILLIQLLSRQEKYA